MTEHENQHDETQARARGELRECPKCNHPMKIVKFWVDDSGYNEYAIACTNKKCPLTYGVHFDGSQFPEEWGHFETEQDAIEDWNTRADDGLLDEAVTALERIEQGCMFPEDDVQKTIRDVARAVLTRIRERKAGK